MQHGNRSENNPNSSPPRSPVTGVMNTHRRFSYLMPEVRTAANLKKFKGWAKKNGQTTTETTSATTEQAAN